MKRKVIYVSYMRLSEKVARDWYIDFLMAKGVAVEYWDLVPLLFGGEVCASKQTDYLRTPRTYQEIHTLLQFPENTGALYMMLISYEGRTADVYRLFSQHACRTWFIAWGALPVNSESRVLLTLRRAVSKPAKFAQAFYYKIKAIAYRKLKLVKPYDVVFAAGRALLASKHYANKVVPINLVDYDHYVRVLSEKTRPAAGSFAIFLDIYLPHQTDLAIVGELSVDPQEYYASLNRFFGFLEEKYKFRVVIAAHPKATYGAETFQGREIYQGLTPELVRDAKFVISHHSTSISYAVLNAKPIIFVYTDAMVKAYRATIVSFINDFAGYLDAAVYNIDKITGHEQIEIRKVDQTRYENYKYDFLTSPESEQLTTQEIFWRQIATVEE
jgi:hypothetical protein